MSGLRTIIAIDQGTTSSRAILFDEKGTILAQQSAEFPQHFPADGWVEHDPEDIWQTTVDVTSAMVAEARSRGSMPIAIGITNQRETAVIWDRATGKPIHNAIVWQDRRTADICAAMKNAGKESTVTEKTGLLLIPILPPRNCPGSWTRSRVHATAPPPENFVSAPSTVF